MTFVMYIDDERLPIVVDVAAIRCAGDLVESGARCGQISGQLVAVQGSALNAPRPVTVPFGTVKRIECLPGV